MVVRARYKIESKLRDTKCYYCDKSCCGILIFSDGSECWSCEKCAFFKGKVKKMVRYLSHTEKQQLSAISKDIITRKNRQVAIFEGEVRK